MRLPFHSMMMILFVAVLLSACNSAEQKKPEIAGVPKATPGHPPPTDGIRRVTVDELKDLLARDVAIVIDVRNQGSYDQGHIKGARLIPATEIQLHLAELPKDKTIVTYCS